MNFTTCSCWSLSSCAIALLFVTGANADEGRFSTLSYNVAGLLEPFSSSHPAENTPLISCRLRGYDLVNVQEDFNYHAALYDTCDDHRYRSATSGGMGVGSGLNTLSYFAYADFARVRWVACNGVDCLTPKGWTQARVRLAEGVYVSLFNLHAQAQTETADLTARRANVLQLLQAIEAEAGADAIIVMGDTNTRYTRSGDNIGEFLKHGFTDVWVETVRGGVVPVQGAPALTSCANTTDASCEVVDKLLFRSNAFVSLRAFDYRVDSTTFVGPSGGQLSDHFPVSAQWAYTTADRFRLSDPWGGPHGVAFNDVALLPSDPVVTRLVLRGGDRIDRIEATLSTGAILSHGGPGGSDIAFDLASGEVLSSLEVCTGTKSGQTRVFSLSATTSGGRVLARGARTSACTSFNAPAGYSIVGFHGRSGDELDKLGVVYGRRGATVPAARYVQVVNASSGLCLDVEDGKMASGTNVRQWTCNGADAQKWSYDAATGLVRSKQDPRYCLDNDGNYGDGANIRIWACSGNANQRFDLDAGAGTLRMRTNPIQVVDAIGTTSGNDVITYSDWGGTNQRWGFVP